MEPDIAEKEVVRLWSDIARRAFLVSEDGELITVVNTGRPNDSPGADFREATVQNNGILYHGDIEIHVRSSQWREHRHHRDSNYNRVVLHVALRRDEATSCSTSHDGKTIPLVTLQKYLENDSEAQPGASSATVGLIPCCQQNARRLPSERLAVLLDTAGERRFHEKAARMRREIAGAGAAECLYRYIMSALGYSRNKLPFRELAHRLPLQYLENSSREIAVEENILAHLQGLLLGAAGLLPSQRPGCQVHRETGLPRLEPLSAVWHPVSMMSCNDWCLFRVRPLNYPVRRLIAMSYLLVKHRREGLLNGILRAARTALPDGRSAVLEEALTVTVDGYWAFHYDYGAELRKKCVTLLGKERVAEIIINVLLPFVFAYGTATSQPWLAEKTMIAYLKYHVPPGNAITREMMARLSPNPFPVTTACRQQGLIYLYQHYCVPGKCEVCKVKV